MKSLKEKVLSHMFNGILFSLLLNIALGDTQIKTKKANFIILNSLRHFRCLEYSLREYKASLAEYEDVKINYVTAED